ncbi:MAG: GntR family transcriptional regulator [Acidobacteriaceae bacterium]
MPADAEELASAIKRAVALPDQVADYLRGMILSGRWPPGQRIVETRIAKELGIGQPTVREALGKLEEAGLVVRTQNSGCTVTQLTRTEVDQIFRMRIEMEGLAVELAVENRDKTHGMELKIALNRLQVAALSKSVEDFYRADLELHRTIWKLAGNRFLEKALSQIVIPLFAFTTIEILAHPDFELALNAQEHEKLVEAILTSDKAHARSVANRMLKEFWHEGYLLIDKGKKGSEEKERKPHRRKKPAE